MLRKHRNILLLIAFLIISISAHLQTIDANYSSNDSQQKKPFILSAKADYGFLIIHSPEIQKLKGTHPKGMEVSANWLLTGDKQWNTCLCYPRVGVLVNYYDYQNPDILGQSIGINGFVEPHYGIGNRLGFSFRAMAGISYLNRPYDSISNPTNMSYSMHVGAFLNLSAILNIKLNENWYLTLFGKYNHISNGGIKLPNKGLNFPTAGIGLDYNFNPEKIIKREKIKPDLKNNRLKRLDVGFFTAYQYVTHRKFPKFLFGLSACRSWQVGRISALDINAEFVYHGIMKHWIEHNENYDGTNHYYAAIAGGHEFLMNRFIFKTQFGVYLYKPFTGYDDVYQRYELMYKMTKHVYLAVGLLSHGHVAAFLDYRLGITF